MSKTVLVTGGRDFNNRQLVYEELDRDIHVADRSYALVIHGGATGVDSLAADWAHKNGVHTARVDALWEVYGKAAGPLRNAAMASLYPDVLLAFPGGKGTESMIRIAHDLGIYVERVTE